MKINNCFIALLPVLFILISSFLGTASIDNELRVAKYFVFPEIISKISYFAYFLSVTILAFLGLLRVFKINKTLTPILFLVFSYFILVFWSLFTFSEQIRYLTIFFSILLCPVGLSYVIERIDLNKFSKSIIVILSLLLFFSVIYSILNYSTHPRVSGIHNNPNLMGMWLVSLLSIILYLDKKIDKKIIFTFIAIVAFLVIFSGSRLAFGALFIVLIPFLFKHKALFVSALLFVSIYFLLVGVNFDFRAVDMSSAVSDSGRIHIWSRAFTCISSEPLVGHGMLGAENCVNSGNVHNSYLRVSVMLGIPLALVFFSSFFAFLAKVMISPVSPYIKFYFLSLPALLFAEDYIVGFASPFFPFLIFMLALYLFDLKQNKALSKGTVVS